MAEPQKVIVSFESVTTELPGQFAARVMAALEVEELDFDNLSVAPALEPGEEWLVVHTDSYNIHAVGGFSSEDEAIKHIWDEVIEGGYEPMEGETPRDYYIDVDDTWVVKMFPRLKDE